jgi:DNA-binding NarL/FixJ family response regulator
LPPTWILETAVHSIRVFVVDDHWTIREGLRRLLEIEPQFEFAGESDGTGDVCSLVEAMHPDVVIMDFRLPVVEGDELTRRLKGILPHVQILGISFSDDSAQRRMIDAGADAFLPKTELRETGRVLRALAGGAG